MRTILDYFPCSTNWSFTAKVSHTLFSNDDVYVVFGRVNMATHGNNSRNLTTFSRWRRSKDWNIAISLIVARTTDTIHQRTSTNVTGILITIKVAFQRCIDGYHTQPTNHLWRIGNLALANRKVFREIIHVVIHHLQSLVSHRHGRCRSIADASFQHIVDCCILYHFWIYIESRNEFAGSQSL